MALLSLQVNNLVFVTAVNFDVGAVIVSRNGFSVEATVLPAAVIA